MPRKTRVLYSSNRQVGTSNRIIDMLLKAYPPGKRLSKNGKVYYEYRRNRSDKKNRKV